MEERVFSRPGVLVDVPSVGSGMSRLERGEPVLEVGLHGAQSQG